MRIKFDVGLSVGIFVIFIMASFLWSVPDNKSAGNEITFFCGAAVKAPMEELIPLYEKKTKVKINVMYGGSGTLLSQMALAKKGDVYLCGSPDYIAIGENKKLLIPKSAKRISYLVPAIIVPEGNPKKIQKLEDLARPGVRVGMGNPETVCLGLYGIEILDHNRLMEKVLPNVKVFAKSCEDTAALAALGKVDAIIGWDVFESWTPSSVDWIKIDKKRIPRLAYIAVALPVYVKNRSLAEDFINYLLSDEAKVVWKKYGYISDLKDARKFVGQGAAIGGEYKIPQEYYKTLKKIHRP